MVPPDASVPLQLPSYTTGVGVTVGVSVGIRVGVSVGTSVGVSVEVGVGVEVVVGVGVKVGPSSCPGPQPDTNRLPIRKKMTVILSFVFMGLLLYHGCARQLFK